MYPWKADRQGRRSATVGPSFHVCVHHFYRMLPAPPAAPTHGACSTGGPADPKGAVAGKEKRGEEVRRLVARGWGTFLQDLRWVITRSHSGSKPN